MTADPVGRIALGPLFLLPAAIREPVRPLRAVLVGWMLSAAVSLALALLVFVIAPQAERPQFPTIDPVGLIVMLVLFAPLLETLIMAIVLELLTWLRTPPVAAILLSSAGWGVAHSLEAPVWGLVIWWPFLVFSTLYMTWRQRSFSAGVAVAAATHACQNLIPALLLISELRT